MLFYAKSTILALVLYCTTHGYINCAVQISVSNEEGYLEYHTHYYKQFKDGSISFVDDRNDEIKHVVGDVFITEE